MGRKVRKEGAGGCGVLRRALLIALPQPASLHLLRAGSTPAPVDPLACLLQEAQRRHFELVTWSTECL